MPAEEEQTRQTNQKKSYHKGLDYGAFGIDPVARTIRIVDSGDEPVSTCSLAFIARAVVAVLEPHRERETANRYLEVVEHAVTQNALRRLLEEETATTTRGEFTVVDRLNAADLARSRDEKLARGDLQGAFFEALWVMAFADGVGIALKEEETANRELGLESKDLREIIRDFVKTRGL
ncbi:hypothetical protein VTI28DRAFT_35 [Corynascus sepedonium]